MPEIWKILIVTVLSAVALGSIIGVATGKHAVKKAQQGYKPLLSNKERLIYAACLVVGAACILCGLFAVPQPASDSADPANAQGGMMEGDFAGDGMMMEGVAMAEDPPPSEGTPDDAAENPQGDGADDSTDETLSAEGEGEGTDPSSDEVEAESEETPAKNSTASSSGGGTATAQAQAAPSGGRVVVRGGGTVVQEVIIG